MQAFQAISDAVNDGASFQRLRDTLQDMPRRLLARIDSSSDSNYLLGSVTGEFNYHFTFRLEGGGFFQTGVLVASAERTPGGLPVPLKCRWKRRVGDLPVEIPGVTSNMYQISADDVGTDIFVEAQPADSDDGLYGIAIGEIGPFELDPATRRSLDNSLGVSGNKFTVSQLRSAGDSSGTAASRQDLMIHVSTEGVKVAPASGTSSSREVVAEYSAEYPRVIIHPLDTTKFQLVMNESRTFHLVASGRTVRDLIALTVRCFHAKRYLSTTSILQALLPVQALVPGTPMGQGALAAVPDQRLDGCILLERLIKELNRSMQQKEVSEKMLRNTNNEKKELQAQLIETISGFTEVIESLNDQFEDGSPPQMPAVHPDKLQEQVHDVSRQNRALESDIQGMRREVEKLETEREARLARGTGPQSSELAQLGEERGILKARLKDLTSSGPAANKEQADQVHMQELKRLRMDVEALHAQKEALRHQLQDADKERQDLQENFLYCKGQLDKVQIKQAQVASGDYKEDLRRQERLLHAAGEERNRLSSRLEQALNELEKEKAYHEQQVERIVQANARLHEEKDRAQREVQRVSELYRDSVNNLGQVDDLNQTAAGGVFRTDSSAAAPWESPVDQAEVARVRAEMDELNCALQKREQENESLKNRIRKLAVA